MIVITSFKPSSDRHLPQLPPFCRCTDKKCRVLQKVLDMTKIPRFSNGGGTPDLHSAHAKLCSAPDSPRRALERSLRTNSRRRWVADEARACRLPIARNRPITKVFIQVCSNKAQSLDLPEGVESTARQWICIFQPCGFTDGCKGKAAAIAARFASSLHIQDISKPEKFKPGVTWPLERASQSAAHFRRHSLARLARETFWRRPGRGQPSSTCT